VTAPLAVVVGFIGKLPVAGMALYNLHYIAGLQELGYEVHYVERQNRPLEYYDPATDAMTDALSAGLPFLESVLTEFGVSREEWSLIDLAGTCHGSGWARLDQAISRADFVLNLADATWFDSLERCPRRAFVDGDPLFTQVAMLTGGKTADALARYPVLFTYCTRMGAGDCTVPDAGRRWHATRPVTATRRWVPDRPRTADRLPVTTIMNWQAWSTVEWDGRSYGQKGPELERLMDLPARTGQRIVLAMGGPAPRKRLMEQGWELANPLEVSGSLAAYRAFIAGSKADLGIAKHAYVASRSGWFSDRSTCYLAAGRPVLHQETGFTDWLPGGEGVFAFSDADGLLDALGALDRDYDRHARAARAIAEEYFEARHVIGRMLDQAGFR
jgi:hypothetical protein